jgi:hypothetical protein
MTTKPETIRAFNDELRQNKQQRGHLQPSGYERRAVSGNTLALVSMLIRPNVRDAR